MLPFLSSLSRSEAHWRTHCLGERKIIAFTPVSNIRPTANGLCRKEGFARSDASINIYSYSVPSDQALEHRVVVLAWMFARRLTDGHHLEPIWWCSDAKGSWMQFLASEQQVLLRKTAASSSSTSTPRRCRARHIYIFRDATGHLCPRCFQCFMHRLAGCIGGAQFFFRPVSICPPAFMLFLLH